MMKMKNLNFEDEVKEALKVLKRLKHLLPRFENALRNVKPIRKDDPKIIWVKI